jgi:ribosomal protein S18 acetylase RimI-like enzyme
MNEKPKNCIVECTNVSVAELVEFLTNVDTLFPTALSERESLQNLASKIEMYGTISYIKVNGTIVALCAGYTNDQKNHMGYISVVATLPEYEQNGYGNKVVRNYVERARKIGMKAVHLYAARENDIALHLYKKMGFIDLIINDEPRPNDKHLILWLY